MHSCICACMYACNEETKFVCTCDRVHTHTYIYIYMYIYIYTHTHTSLNPQPRNPEPVSSLRPGLVAAQQRDTSGLHEGVSALIREWGLGNL